MRLIFCAVLLWFGVIAGCQADSLIVDRDGIKIWTYKIPNYPVRGFRATTVVKSSLEGLVSLIQDTSRARDWIYHVDSIDMVKRDDNEQKFVVRAKLNFWPLKDRDAYIQGHLVQDPRTLTVYIDSTLVPQGVYPEDDGFVRMADLQGHWILRPIGQGNVEVTMSGRADPGGDIPKFLLNMLIQENPYNTLLGLQKLVSEDRYQKAVVKQIREP